MTTRRGSPAPSITISAPATLSGSKFGPPRPPRKTTWQSGLPGLVTRPIAPTGVMPKNVWPLAAARHASAATWTDCANQVRKTAPMTTPFVPETRGPES